MSQENAALARRWYEEIWNQGNLDAMDQLIAPDARIHGHAPNDGVIGLAEFKEFARTLRASFPDVRVIVEQTISEGDLTAIRWRSELTHRAEFAGAAPTGRAVMVRGMSIMRFVGGKIVEGWDNWDQLGLLTQIGAVAPAGIAA